jgi:hypothetical protein
MASPLPTAGKATVDLSAPGVKGSRIRRNPPPVVRELSLAEIRARDLRHSIVGILIFTLALTVILWGAASIAGWTPAQYTLRF